MNNSKKNIITYGTFDNFHIGHLNLLLRAKKLGDKLIVGISTDKFNELKSKKCIYPFEVRKKIVEGLSCVDKVIPENNWEQKIDDIKENKVDIFVMGDDWKGKFDNLSEFCKVKYLPRTNGISTSKLKDNFAGEKFLSNGEKNNDFVSKGTGLIDHYIFNPIIFKIVKLGLLSKVSPNFLTTLGLILSIVSSVLILKGYMIQGLIVYIFFPLIDLMDGAVARYYRKTSTIGAFYDGLIDSISEIIILLSLGFYFGEELIFLYLVLFILFVQMFLYRLNWILEIKERQINFLNVKGLMLLPIILTRNDSRKVLLLIFSNFGYFFSFSYFIILYILALLNGIFTLYKRNKQGKK